MISDDVKNDALYRIIRQLTGHLSDVDEKLEAVRKEMADLKELHQIWKQAKKVPSKQNLNSKQP